MARKNGGLRFQPSGGTRAAQVPVGKKQRLKIERLANDGRGIAFIDNRTWFVSGALPGEEVEARVLDARSKVIEARTERVFQASPERREEPCVHARVCGGCSVQHMAHEQQLALKQRMLAEQLQRLAGLQPEVWAEPLSGPEFAYRRRARIAVRWDMREKRLEVGFRAAASQDIVAISDCPVLVEPLQPILRALPALLSGLQAPRAIGHVELFQGTASAVLVRHTEALSEVDLARLQAFCSVHHAQLWLHGEGEPQPADATHVLGYRLDTWDLQLAYRPGDFVQVNAAVNEAMVAQALQWLAPRSDERVLDLFCGLGNFALPLAQQAREVIAVEGVQAMVERAAGNARDNGLGNAHFYQADLSKSLTDAGWVDGGFDAVLLDPPRDGALQVVQQIAALGAKRLVYVSCNPTTLARDSSELIQQGYRLKKAGILDMFPQTAHVEAMALFER
ncbi:23S rRNA (uracil(1939)-C(5))-methyltransferase RlmD [Phytopseudomonas seleniipraecipitans]|uniref:23S rRNA (uracil(1939)-C(5))-methyltransferase RlmD n=1 Tax=Phytopseudomonas seleniipraecipitans TaxID=640205 RepID=A0A1G7H4Y3_9GAMM|nr:23S rRNA (uracil(1939)-C(5))-methyltransferase RlmD [Pseudomonas seleniipraecipitans]SDE95500.1 23S rRNA m(5)U-1939 methyltransferase [Pseudomonas seleniipraecipitans]